ncbi:MAG: RNA polymerase sigma factor [Fimbriimonadaceae bacterium]
MNAATQKPTVSDVLQRELDLLYRVARRLTGNDPDAEDLVSQTIEIAFKNWDKFDGQHPKSWLITILRNEFYQSLRKSKRRAETTFEESHEPIEEDFWQEIDRKLQVDKILEAVDSLPDDYREVITLCDIEELTYDEAATILKIPIGTIKSRLFRGRKQVRSILIALNPQ